MRAFRRLETAGILSAALTGLACVPTHNYAGPGPRYAGGWRPVAAPASTSVIRVVSFNIRYAREIDRATHLLQESPSLRGADVIALQEMDAPGTERIATALGCEYVYYPAAFLASASHDFGNAILVRGHIEDDRKLVLPHAGRFGGMQRIAVRATVGVRGQRIRVYSVHLGTPKELAAQSRRDQIQAIVEDARSADGPVVVAGDFNGRNVVVDAFLRSGYDWTTRGIGRTIALFSWDHVFVRGLSLASTPGRGVAENNEASDHRPVWVELKAAEAPGATLSDNSVAAP